ncbi:MAG: DUF5674 family protein [bacterium]|nr:DUF5674 family protein [bacterium]
MNNIILVHEPIEITKLKELAEHSFSKLVKAVIDIEKEIMVIGGELHADEEELLLKNNSKQDNLWGINIYPSETKDNRIEFDSIINIRYYNKSRYIENPEIREKIIKIVNKLIID